MQEKIFSLSLSRLTCSVPNYKYHIEKLIKSNITDPLYLNFAHNFLSYIPIDYDFENNQDIFFNLMNQSFEFFKYRKKETNKIHITNSLINGNNAIDIMIIQNNKSFIVDSIICLLSRLAIKTKFIMHPVMHVVRNEHGELLKIEENSNIAESFVHIVIYGNFNDAEIKFLHNEIVTNLQQVESTYEIWKKIPYIITKEQNHLNETNEFLQWLTQDNFTFLGILNFKVTNQVIIEELGAKTIWHNCYKEIKDIIKYSTNELYLDQQIILGKLNAISLVHKDNLVDYILVKHIDENNIYTDGIIIFGLYSSNVKNQSIKNIPILREKLQFVINKSKFLEGTYNYKNLCNIIESLPKDSLIQIDQGDLYCMSYYILSAMMSKKLKLFMQQDWSGNFVNIIIVLPNTRLNSTTHHDIDLYITEKFLTEIISSNLTPLLPNISYLFITLKLEQGIEIDVEQIEGDLDNISRSWIDDLYKSLAKKIGEYNAGLQLNYFANLFSFDYKNKFTPDIALIDYEYLSKSSIQNSIISRLTKVTDQIFELRFYNIGKKLSLSSILPLIENLDFTAIEEQSFIVSKSTDFDQSWIYKFDLIIDNSEFIIEDNIEEILYRINQGLLSNDILNKLGTISGLKWQEINLIKAIASYIIQVNITYDKLLVQTILLKYGQLIQKIISLFHALFDINIKRDYNYIENLHVEIKYYLLSITNNIEDKVLTSIYNTICAITRTNYYNNLKNQLYISFKINSSLISNIPKPVPFAEIFVYSSEFEAIHLRFGKISRGGLRWSDREHDYRTEVLGLMKAQVTKNSIIVPTGAKGGFFVRISHNNMSKEEYNTKIIESYKNFLRGMLDITDNIIDGVNYHPNIICYDKFDPYLVVAADKGTASFSDYANSISLEYNFWLGDAFASGGSAGYDHKKMAITSKGAWISVINHFNSINIDPYLDYIRVVGIGDMSGDVFGNGMLRSKTIKLVAAFNHRHIFIDPNPDNIISYNERARLFNLPSSNWSDYNHNLISKGGGVFERNIKSINISLEMQDLLKITDLKLSPDDLIRAILKAPIDLIWNGGIGTYIKAKDESNLNICDKANDNLRCNAIDIRAKIIGEGGNLGVSQLGRIEYSLNGGILNTDFIDNSAGVSCSDHEVNIKIILNNCLKNNKITLETRNILLNSMTNQIEQLVLEDNYKQNQIINIMANSSIFTIDMFCRFIDYLENNNYLNRELEFLSSNDDLYRREKRLTRPELAIILSYGKIALFDNLSDLEILDEEYYNEYLIDYFPLLMQKDFLNEILNHQLKNEIIKTIITNKLINQLSPILLHNIMIETNASIIEIIKSYIIICKVFNIDKLWHEIENTTIQHNIKISIFTEIINIIKIAILWFIKNKSENSINETIEEYKNYIHNYKIQSIKNTEKSEYIDNSIAESLSNLKQIIESIIL